MQNARGGTVILFQLDHSQIGKIDLQLLQVFNCRAAPCIDRLIVIAHCRKHRFLADARDEQLYQLVLTSVGVLVFIDQQVAQPALPFITHRFLVAKQFHRQADQVVEINCLIGGQGGDVTAVNARGLRVVFGNRVFQRGVGIDQAVLPQRHRSLDAADQLLVGRERQVLHQRKTIVAVHDREAVFQT